MQDILEQSTRLRLAGSPGAGLDLEIETVWERRSDGSSTGSPTDLMERDLTGELGWMKDRRIRYSVHLDTGTKRDRLSRSRLHGGKIGPGVDIFFGGRGNIRLEYHLEELWNDTPAIPVPRVMIADGDVGTTHRYRFRANWRLRGALDLTASLDGRRRPGRGNFEHTGRTDFTYRF